ncbi:hypothetical protein MTO96_028066 [Rhipicephalus appendiculatus]
MMGTKQGILAILSFCCMVNSINVTIYVFGSYRNINSKGAAYDAAFGIETLLNLFSDFKMIGSLQRDVVPVNNAIPTEKMVKTLNVFLIWNTGSTLFCYVGHIAASKFASKYEIFESTASDVDEESYRRASFINGAITYTVIALVKAYVLYYIYTFYVECKRAATLPPVIAPAVFVDSAGGGTGAGQETVVVLIRESSSSTINPSTGSRSVGKEREVVRVSGEEKALSPSAPSTQNEANVPSRPSEVTSAEVKARSASDESVFGGSRRLSQQALEIPDAVFPAVRTGDGAVAGPSRPRHGAR